MDARLLRRVACPAASSVSAATQSSRRLLSPACSLLQSTPTSTTSPLIPQQRRHQSTANRTKRALNIAPHASFLKSGGGRDKYGAGSSSGSHAQVATALGTIESSTTTLLYNPPASAPSVYQTPFKFLPKSDPRRRQNLSNLFSKGQSAPSPTPTPTAPELAHRNFDPAPKSYHLTPEDVAEIRRLRTLDPIQWSVHTLAHKYECSPIFIMKVVRSSPEHQAAHREARAKFRERWGPIKAKARADRVKRKEMLYNGEL